MANNMQKVTIEVCFPLNKLPRVIRLCKQFGGLDLITAAAFGQDPDLPGEKLLQITCGGYDFAIHCLAGLRSVMDAD